VELKEAVSFNLKPVALKLLTDSARYRNAATFGVVHFKDPTNPDSVDRLAIR
jgi:hypothetical protein